MKLITLTKKAVDKARSIEKEKHQQVRFGLQKGGCSGWMYEIALGEAKEQDVIVEQEGAKVIVAANAKDFLKGSTIDYQDTLQDSGFKIDNPNLTKQCGCGHSVG